MSAEIKIEMDEDVPLIPKPPSFEMAMAMINGCEVNSSSSEGYFSGGSSSGQVSVTPTTTPRQISNPAALSPSSSTVISSPLSSVLGPPVSLKPILKDSKHLVPSHMGKDANMAGKGAVFWAYAKIDFK